MNKLQKMRSKLKDKKGFTLIELIVVIAIIGILVLLAAPKFLGHTKDANVSAMQADAKALSNAALVYYVEGDVNNNVGEFPVGAQVNDSEVPTTVGEVYEINDSKLEYKGSLKNDIEDYVIVQEGEYEGQVFHKDGIKGNDGKLHFGGNVEK